MLLVESIVEFEPKVPMETFPSFSDPFDTTLLDQLFVVAIYMWYSFGQQMTGRSSKTSAKSKIVESIVEFESIFLTQIPQYFPLFFDFALLFGGLPAIC